jgi:hypothetical protein
MKKTAGISNNNPELVEYFMKTPEKVKKEMNVEYAMRSI